MMTLRAAGATHKSLRVEVHGRRAQHSHLRREVRDFDAHPIPPSRLLRPAISERACPGSPLTAQQETHSITRNRYERRRCGTSVGD
jgi:hypothetical protein